MPADPRPWIRRHRRGLRIAALALVACYLLYVVAAAVFLNTGLRDLAFNRQPERFHVTWTRGWSPYPGAVVLRGVQVGGHSRNLRWLATAPRARAQLKLLSLFGRNLSFGVIRGEQVSFVLDRHAPFQAPRPGRKRADDRWQLHFDGIHAASVRMLYLGGWRVDDLVDATATFAFEKTLGGGNMEIGPSSLQAASSTIAWRDTVVSRDARIDYTMTMAPSSRRLGTGFGRIRFVDAALKLEGTAPGLALGGGERLLAFDHAGTPGRLAADLAIAKGVLQPGGWLTWSAPLELVVDAGAKRVERMQARATVDDAGIRVRAAVPPRDGRRDHIDADLLVGERRLQALHEVGAVLANTSGEVAMDWSFGTLRWLNPLITRGEWLRLDGSARVVADLRLRGGRLAAGSNARLEDAQVAADVFATVVTAAAHAEAKVGEDQTTVEFVADAFKVAPEEAPEQAYVEGRGLRLDLVASGDLAQFRRTVRARLRFDDARMPQLSAWNRNLPGDSLRFEGGQGTFGADLAMDADGAVRAGGFRLRGRDARVRVGTSLIAGDLGLDTRISRLGEARDAYRVDALSLDLDRVRVASAKPDAEPWWARLRLDRGSMHWQQPFRFDGDARLRMKDASVLLDLFSERSAFPAWIARIVDEGETRATARVAFEGEQVTIDDLSARNERVDLDAKLRIATGVPRGALFARWGILRVAAEVDGKHRKMHVRGARAWYDAQPALLPPR